MANVRDPRQVHELDRTELRKRMKAAIGPDLILDSAEWNEALDFSYTSGRLSLIRKACIAATRSGVPKPRQLDASEYLALARYVQGDGPRPRWAKYVDAAGHFGTSHRRDDDPEPAPKPEPWPQQDPNEPGRYVQAKGRFAMPAEPEFTPDPR